MRVIQEVLKEVTQTFASSQIPSPRRQAEELLCDLLQYDRLKLYIDFERPLNQGEWTTCQEWVRRRLKGEPLAYIHGKVSFYGCSLTVNPAVLIPRQETEILVDQIVKNLKKEELKGKVLWDLCCGSGCIGIALKKSLPDLDVYLMDHSTEALAVAKQNALSNQVDVQLIEGDLLKPLANQKAHFVVCNPPYISESEYLSLSKEVKEHEPRLALVGGLTGLEFYERLAHELPAHLYPQSKVWFEIGYQQGEALQQLFNQPPWKNQQLSYDWAGHPRFFFLENE